MANLIPKFSPNDVIIEDFQYFIENTDDFKNIDFEFRQESISEGEAGINITTEQYTTFKSQSKQYRVLMIEYYEKSSTKIRNRSKSAIRERAILFYEFVKKGYLKTYTIPQTRSSDYSIDIVTVDDNDKVTQDKYKDLNFVVDPNNPSTLYGLFYLIFYCRNPYWNSFEESSTC